MQDAIACLLVAAIWGFTNQLIKKHTPVIKEGTNLVDRLRVYVTSPRFIAAFLANQTGSLLFYFTLSSASASAFIPTVNALTLLFTFIFEHKISPSTSKSQLLGVACILTGSYLLAQ